VVHIEPGTPAGRAAAPSPRRSSYDPEVTLFSPRTFPGQRVRVVAGINRWLSRMQITRAMDRIGLSPPDIVIAHSPGSTGYLWPTFPEALRVLRNWDFLHPMADRSLIGSADLILTSSSRYMRMGTFPSKKTRYLPNSTDDYAILAEERLMHPHPVPAPTAGTMGTFSFTVDLPLLVHVVRRCSNLEFLFQGSFWDRGSTDELRRANVQLVERNDSDTTGVEAFLRRVHVGLCPYRRSEWVLHSSPTRLLAFLRAGVPVVATDFSPDALAPFIDLPGLLVAGDEESYSRAIYQALEMCQDPHVVRGMVRRAQPFLSENVGAICEAILSESLQERRGR
jgi:glycosyltransferase involved in cell wall biosynthesis